MSTNDKSNDTGLTYAQAGVDIDAGNALVKAIKPLAASTSRAGADAALGGFGGIFDLKATGYRDPLLIAANDGVGTKLKIAIDAGRNDTVGIDLVAMCVNDLIVQGAEPLFFLDYLATGALKADQAQAIIAGIAEGCRKAGCALIGGETAEMPGFYADDDYDLAGFAVGAVERNALLPRNDLAAGDMVLGLASSGVHSNGFSLVRRIVDRAALAYGDPAPFAPEKTLGEALLEPTRIYVRPLLTAIGASGAIKAMAHITGGGLPENLPRVLPDHLGAQIALSGIDVPAVFGWLARAGGIGHDEMLRTFNCGIGMVVIVAPDAAQSVTDTLTTAGETVVKLGTIVARTGDDACVFEGRLTL